MSSTTNSQRRPILEQAWQRHAELDQNAIWLNKRHQRNRWWVAILGIVATFLAIFIDNFTDGAHPTVQLILKVLLIGTPLLGSVIAAYTARELGDGRWLAMRAGAEEIRKNIYLYRTVLKEHPDRNKWLSNQLAEILRQVYKNSNNKLDTIPYTGDLPPKHSHLPEPDNGFSALSPEEYIRLRLQEQLEWHENRIVRHSRDKRNLTIAILSMGALGALLAGIGGPFTVWVALTASTTAALNGWEELKNREKLLLNYSKVKLELSIIRDFWYGLSPEEQSDSAFYRLVLATEALLLSQTTDWFYTMRQTLAGIEDEDKKLVEEMVQAAKSGHTEIQKQLKVEAQTVQAQEIERIGETADRVIGSIYDDAKRQTAVVDTAVDPASTQPSPAYSEPFGYTPESSYVEPGEATGLPPAMPSSYVAEAATNLEAWAASEPTEGASTPTETAGWTENAEQTAVELNTAEVWQGVDEQLLHLGAVDSDPLIVPEDEIIKYATDFVPVEEVVEETIVPEVAYEAEPDVKYAIEIMAEEPFESAELEEYSETDTAVDAPQG